MSEQSGAKRKKETLQYETVKVEEMSGEDLARAATIIARWIYEAEMREKVHVEQEREAA